ncbi:MAG: glycosyltransferase family 2 protein [Ancrocorticia sp.]|nr:glycosyltransferase family 2 protein [Ancrocorticia sp.]
MSDSPLRIVTVAYNQGPELEALAASIPEAVSRPWELVVVDNGKPTDSVHKVELAGATVIRPGLNLGYGPAVNWALREYQGDWAVIVNPDVVFSRGSIDELLEGARYWPTGGAFGPMILTPEGLVYPSARKFPRLIAGSGHALLANVWPENPATRAYRENEAVGDAHVVDWLSGSCMLVRMRAFREVDGFDPRFFMFFEDTQFGEDLKKVGWQSVFLPEAVITHEQGTSWKDKPARMLREHHRSAAKYLDGVYSHAYQAPLRAVLHVGLWVRGEVEVQLAKREQRSEGRGEEKPHRSKAKKRVIAQPA